jgi:glycosyltransferase involved in cell wall biosynthesis
MGADSGGGSQRVLMTADTVGGVWQFAIELARGLARNGDEVALATLGATPSADQLSEARSVPGLTLYPGGYRLAWMESPWEEVERAGRWLQSVAEEVRPDVIHLNDYSHGELQWNAPVVVTGHSCVLSWWQAVHGVPAPAADWTRYADSVRRGLHGADAVVAPTAAMLDRLQHHYGPLRATRVIANGRTPQRPPAGARPAREPLVLSAGRVWDAAKNISTLAAVAPRLPWPVCVAGEQRHPDGGHSLLDNVRLLGRLSSAELAPWFSRASIYALPARYEPFGLSALEAAQAGCALVLGDIDSLREVWGDAATFVPPDDAHALEDALQRLIAQPALRQRQARMARARAERYSAHAMVNAYRRLYAELAHAQTAMSAPRRAAGASLGAHA